MVQIVRAIFEHKADAVRAAAQHRLGFTCQPQRILDRVGHRKRRHLGRLRGRHRLRRHRLVRRRRRLRTPCRGLLGLLWRQLELLNARAAFAQVVVAPQLLGREMGDGQQLLAHAARQMLADRLGSHRDCLLTLGLTPPIHRSCHRSSCRTRHAEQQGAARRHISVHGASSAVRTEQTTTTVGVIPSRILAVVAHLGRSGQRPIDEFRDSAYPHDPARASRIRRRPECTLSRLSGAAVRVSGRAPSRSRCISDAHADTHHQTLHATYQTAALWRSRSPPHCGAAGQCAPPTPHMYLAMAVSRSASVRLKYLMYALKKPVRMPPIILASESPLCLYLVPG